MKRYILYILLAGLVFACKEDEEIIFDVNLDQLELTFEPYEGGAYLNYSLPANTAIYGIQAKYLDFLGKEIIVKGTHTNNQLDLFGFNEAMDNVPVEISLIDLDGHLSETISESFSTKNSVAVSIFDDIQISSHWNGFRVSSPDIEGRAQGFLNVYYVGINPETNEEDSLLVSSLPITEYGQTIRFTDISDTTIQDVTVVIKTEDSRGNAVKTKVYENIPVSRAGIFDPSQIIFSGSSVEDENKKMGWKYLFDGDVRGVKCLEYGDLTKVFCYRSEEGAQYDNRNVMTFDLQDQKEISWLRIYSKLSALIPNERGQYMQMKLEYQYFYPSHITLYGTNDKDAPESAWVELSSYYESATLEKQSRWTARAYDLEDFYTVAELDLFKAAEPNYIQLDCDITGNTFRYLKMKINETFYYKTDNFQVGLDGTYGMEEVEVYVKK